MSASTLVSRHLIGLMSLVLVAGTVTLITPSAQAESSPPSLNAAGRPDNPGRPAQPGKPDDAGSPTSPDPASPTPPSPPSDGGGGSDGANPDGPPTPGAPDNPGRPDNPTGPDTPGRPSPSGPDTAPEQPGKPTQPGKPDTPSRPDKPDTPPRPDKDDTTQGQFVDVIIRFAPGIPARSGSAAVTAAKGEIRSTIRHVFAGVVASVPAKALTGLRRNPVIDVVERDAAVTVVRTSAGTSSGSNLVVGTTGVQDRPTWGLDRIDQSTLPLDATFSYDDSAGEAVRAYVVDTGIRSDHVEFDGRVSSGFTAINDGRGTEDCNGHGTHVAGTIAGTTFGVAKRATLTPVRVLDCSGSGTWSGVIAGLDWIAAQHTVGQPAVANMSLGGGANSSVDTAVRALIAKGVSVVVAAGNSNADACLSSPARVREAITVAASDVNDVRALFSNHGPCVDLFAPGVAVLSSVSSSSTATATYSGTSMASPHVAGAAALLLGRRPALAPSSLEGQLVADATPDVIADPLASPNRLLKAVAPSLEDPGPGDDSTVPEAPASVSATLTGRKSVRVTWTKPADGGSPITGYVVTAYSGGVAGSWNVGPDATSATISRLRARTTYTFTVRAVNAIGSGLESAPTSPLRTR